MKMMMKFILAGVLSTLGVASAQSIAEIATADLNFTTLVAALELTGLTETLNGDGTFTVFAPSDQAFEAFRQFSPGTLETLLAEDPPNTLTEILLYHVHAEELMASDLADGLVIEMAQQGNATLMAEPPMIEGSNIIEADIEADNGVIHVIDFPLVPPSIPVLPGIAAAASATGQFTVLLSLIEAVGLGAQLNQPGELTVFAPTDEAFAAIPNVESLVADPNAVLGILTGHVVGGYLTSEDLEDGQVLTALNQQSLTVTKSPDGTITVGGSTVIMADILGSNGVVHAIDQVILPAAPTSGPGEAPAPSVPGGAPAPAPAPGPSDGGIEIPEVPSSAMSAGLSLFAMFVPAAVYALL